MVKETFFAVGCNHPKKVSLEITTTNREAIGNIPEYHKSLIKPCPRTGKMVTFDVQANHGVAIAVTCSFTQCPHHVFHQISPSTKI